MLFYRGVRRKVAEHRKPPNKINRTKIAIEIAGLLKSDNFHKISCTRAETVYNIK